mgnify:CR=1|jgi:hypothetical protein
MNKKIILKTYINQFDEFLDDTLRLFPTDMDIRYCKTSFNILKKTNPKMIIKTWKLYIADKYKDQIENNDVNFFMNKNYNDDLVDVSNSQYVIKTINRLKKPMAKMDNDNKNKCMKYLQNLSKLSELYFD